MSCLPDPSWSIVRLKNIEAITGSLLDDKLTGDSLANSFRGGGGIDTIDGGAGSDAADYTDKSQKVDVTLNGATAVTVKVNGINEDSIKSTETVAGGVTED